MSSKNDTAHLYRGLVGIDRFMENLVPAGEDNYARTVTSQAQPYSSLVDLVGHILIAVNCVTQLQAAAPKGLPDLTPVGEAVLRYTIALAAHHDDAVDIEESVATIEELLYRRPDPRLFCRAVVNSIMRLLSNTLHRLVMRAPDLESAKIAHEANLYFGEWIRAAIEHHENTK